MKQEMEVEDKFSVSLPVYMPLRERKPSRRRKSDEEKHCNCPKSKCLMLYCICFAAGKFCKDCRCIGCLNNEDNFTVRNNAISLTMAKNPDAFMPKIGAVAAQTQAMGVVSNESLHLKGCSCKKSNCLMNYCECYEAQVNCSDRCKCISCRNCDGFFNYSRDSARSPRPRPSPSTAVVHKKREMSSMVREFQEYLDEIITKSGS